MKFTEAQLEKVFTELLGQEGFPHHLCIPKSRNPEEVLIEEDLQTYLLTQYAVHGITVNEIKSIILQLKSLSASDLVEGQAKFPEWNKRDDIKSALKVGLILLLDEVGYPPVERDEVYVEIFEQAENFKKNKN